MSKKNFTICFHILFLLIICIQNILCEKHFLVLPYKVYRTPEKEMATKEQIYESLERNYIYTLLYVGNPVQKLPILYNFNNSETTFNSDMNFAYIFTYIVNSNYNPSNSKSFKNIDKNIVEDEFSFLENNTEISAKNLKLLYNNENKDSQKFYADAGLQNFYLDIIRKKVHKTNFLYQLKSLGLIDHMSFSINQTSEYEGFINFNLEPYDFEPDLYSNKAKFKYITNVKGVESNIINREAGEYLWSLEITLIYYRNQENRLITVNTDRYELNEDQYSVLLNPTYGLIKGPFEFKNQIKKDFFDLYMKNNICSLSKVKELNFYSCNATHKKELKERFNPIHFYLQEIDYTFILDFDDLFVEKNGILFFLICYDSTLFGGDKFAQISEWVLGKPFFKKYQFSFDVEKKDIIFYVNKNGYNYTKVVKPKSEYINDTIDFNKIKEYNRKRNLYINKLLPWKNLCIIGLSILIIFISFFCISYCVRANHKKIVDEKKKGILDEDKNSIELKESLNDKNN